MMTCETARPQLEAFYDRELTVWRAWSLRRHLAGCPACAAQVHSLRRLDTLLATADPARRAAVTTPFLLPFRRMRLSLALTGSIAASLLTLALLLWLPGQPGRPTIAFADVEQAMQNVQTAAWSETDTFYDRSDGSKTNTLVTQAWVRLNPPAYARRILPTQVLTDYDRSLTNDQGRITYSSRSRKYMIDRTNTTPGPEMQRQVHNLILGQVLAPTSAAIRVPSRNAFAVISPWQMDTDRVGGRRLLRFRRTVRPRPITSVVKPSMRAAPIDETVWADPRTHFVARVERRIYDAWHPERLLQVAVLAEYRYNVTPPPGVFDLTPPPGAKVLVQDWRGHAVTLTPEEQRQIQQVITHSESGWRTGDFATFAAVWDFDYAHPLPNTPETYRSGAWTRQNWQGIVEHQRDRWRSWQSHVEAQARTTRALGYLDAFGQSGFLPESAPDLLAVKTETHAAWMHSNGGDKAWETTYTLRRVPGGWRIIHWSYRWPFTGQ